MGKEVNRTTVSQINNIVYVEPNYAYSTEMYGSNGLNTYEFIPPPEDYSIFVNLEVEVRGRTIRTAESSDPSKLVLSFETDIDGKTNVNILRGSKIPIGDKDQYMYSMTTDYTDVYLGDLTRKGPKIETFGVSSIDIAYNNYMVPEVTIEFVDIRGATIFAQKEAYETRLNELGSGATDANVDIANTFFQCFFTFPYPKFTLLVKGFYGQPVAYELTCADFRARFDSKTGNFNCTAKFVGYYFSFLGDVMFNILCAAPYSDYLGGEYWDKQQFMLVDSRSGKKTKMPKIVELIKMLKHVDRLSERAAAISPEVQEQMVAEKEKADIGNVKNAYEAFVNVYRSKMQQQTTTEGIIRYFEDKTEQGITKTIIYFAPISDLIPDEGPLINTLDELLGVKDQADSALQALSDAVEEYNDSDEVRYRTLPEPSRGGFGWLADAGLSIGTLITPGTDKSIEYAKEYFAPSEAQIGPSIFIVPKENDYGKARVDWRGHTLSESLMKKVENAVENSNQTSEISNYLCDSDGTGGYQAGFVFTSVVADDIADIMSASAPSQKELVKDIERTKNSLMERYLGWKPSVENLTKIVMAHFETLAYCIFQVGYEIANKNPRRTLASLNINDADDISDVPTNIKNTYVPPFPRVTKIKNHEGDYIREETWVGDYNSPEFLEVELVHGLINGVNHVAEEWHQSGETYDSNEQESFTQLMSTGAVTSVMTYPLSTLDLIADEQIYGEHDTNEISSILGLVALRAIQVLTLNALDDIDDVDYKDLGAMELINYINAVGGMSGEMTQKIKAVSSSDFIKMMEGEESDTIKKPSNGRWPWEFDSHNNAIIDGNNVCAFKTKGKGGVFDSLRALGNTIGIRDIGDAFEVDLTVFPFQNLSWNKFSNEVNDSNIASVSEDYLNTSSLVKKFKKNQFTVDTNIQRIGMICKHQFEGESAVDGADKLHELFTEHLVNRIDFDADEYDSVCLRSGTLQSDYMKKILAFVIQNADKILPTANSGMFPTSSAVAKKMARADYDKGTGDKIIGRGYNMNDFSDVNPGSGCQTGDWHYTKDMAEPNDDSELGPSVTRLQLGEDGSASAYDYYFKRLNNNNITLTEFIGVSPDCSWEEGHCTIFGELLYYRQKTEYAKAFLFLCSVGALYDFNDIADDYIEEEDKSIFVIPLAAVMFYGGLVYYLSNEDEFWNVDPRGQYSEAMNIIEGLPAQVQMRFLEIFKTWVTDGFDGCPTIRSFNDIRAGLELTIKEESHFRNIEHFFEELDEPEDGKSWIEKNGYNSILEMFAYTFTDSFFENYICIDEDADGIINDGTRGIRLGNRDGAPCVIDAVNFALAGCVFMKNSIFFHEEDDEIEIDKGDIEDFFEGFKSRIDEVDASEDLKLVNHAEPPKNTNDDIKVGIYRYLKLLYDKWLAGMSKDEFETNWTFKRFFEDEEKYFHFIDTFYNIAGYIPVNVGHFAETAINCFSTNSQYSILSFLSNIYAHNKFNFLCLQNFINLGSINNMKSMFNLVPYTHTWNIKRIPNFVVCYINEPSSHLDVEGSEYENDGFMINEHWSDKNKWPEPLKSRSAGRTSGYTVPAFGVSYGKMYQSYFTDIAVGMDNPIATEQSIKAQYQIACQAIDGKNSGDRAVSVTYGQDLYAVYSNNSYTCEVTMMGCAWVQPLMYFALNNIPMFRGTYLIQKVHHTITPGNMVTKFTGTRMANTSTRIVEEQAFYKELPDQSSGSTGDDGTGGIINENRVADIDNDCPYKIFPINGAFTDYGPARGGGIPESFLNMSWGELKSKTKNRGEQGIRMSDWLRNNDDITVEQALIAAVGAEYQGFTQNDNMMLKVATAMVCNKYYLSLETHDYTWLIGTQQQGTSNTAATESTYNRVKDICSPILRQGPGILVGLTTKVKDGCNVEVWNRGVTDHSKAPDTHTITLDDMQRVIQYCTMGGYDYEHIGRDTSKVGRQTMFESKKVPNDPGMSWHKNLFLFQEYNSVFCGSPDRVWWEPSEPLPSPNTGDAPIEENGDGHVTDLATGFLNALDKTSASSLANIKLGTDPNKSSADTIYITNAQNSQQFSKVFDMIVNGYGNSISEIKWVLGEGQDISSEPVAYLVTVKEGSTSFKIHVVSETNLNENLSITVRGGSSQTANANGDASASNTNATAPNYVLLNSAASQSPASSSDNGNPWRTFTDIHDSILNHIDGISDVLNRNNSIGGNINANFCKAIRKKYKSFSQQVVTDTDGTLNEENARKIFDSQDYEVKDCSTALSDAGLSSSFGNGAGDNSRWAEVVRKAGQWFAENVHDYGNHYSDYDGVIVGTKNCRHDCTGFVSACLRAYGVNVVWGSWNFAHPDENGIRTMNEGGFDMLKFNSTDELKAQLKPWDIICVAECQSNGISCRNPGSTCKCGENHHAEIYAGDGKSYTWGSVHDVNNGGLPYTMGKHSFVLIWRCREAGGGGGTINTANASGALEGFTGTVTNQYMKNVLDISNGGKRLNLLYLRYDGEPSTSYDDTHKYSVRLLNGSPVVPGLRTCKGQCTAGPKTWYHFSEYPNWRGDITFYPSAAASNHNNITLGNYGFVRVWHGSGADAANIENHPEKFCPGDICLQHYYKSDNTASGHGCMWTGKEWRSDYSQGSQMRAGRSFRDRDGNYSYSIWRHPAFVEDNVCVSPDCLMS